MELNRLNLILLGTGFQTAFQGGLGMAPPQWERVATRVNSSTSQEEYGWLGMIPSIREWLGDRVVQNISTSEYLIKNKPFELTIGVDRDHIQDDNLGIYGPMFTEMGRSTAAFPNQQVFNLLKAGFTSFCYDKQYFFDTDHPVLDATGTPQPVANTDGGSGEPWFLIDTNRALKPILWQVRKDFQFVAKDRVDDDNVFWSREFNYGVDGRANVGFGFWQFAWGSKQTLDPTHYATARAALMGMKGDHGRPLGNVPNLLVVGPSNEGAGRKIVQSLLIDASTNEWAGTAELLVVPWLA